MSNIWNKIDPWIDRQKFAFTSASIFGGIMLLYATITKDKVASSADLNQVEGILSDYSFVNVERGGKRYYLWLEDYSSTFQIPADFLSCFDENKFKVEAIIGEKLSLKISKLDVRKLKEPAERLFIYDLRQGSNIFLSSVETIKKDNSPLLYYGGVGLILAGFGYYFYKKDKIKRYSQPD